MLLSCDGVTVRYGEFTAVSGVSFALCENQWLMLAGPNGSGKSTLLRALMQAVPHAGRVTILGDDARKLSAAALARRMGAMAQQHAAGFGFTVEEVVSLGRYAHRRSLFSAADPDGARAVRDALGRVGLSSLAGQSVLTLSGGELQRVFLAQVLAQDPKIMLLDEPANHLDPAYQKQLFSLIDDWRRQPGRAVISVVHDLSLARRFGTHALLMHDGRCASQGEIASVMTPDNLAAVYDMDVAAWMRELLACWAE